MANKERKTETTWTPEDEVHLFYALNGLRPIGINRHFNMMGVMERFARSTSSEFTSEQIWKHLRSMYNLEALEMLETLPFPNEEKEFALPEAEFAALLAKKRLTNPAEDTKTTTGRTSAHSQTAKENAEKRTSTTRISAVEILKRIPKRTRGSTSIELNSPSTTPPPITSNKRRRI